MPGKCGKKCAFWSKYNECFGCSYQHAVVKLKVSMKDDALTGWAKREIDKWLFKKSSSRRSKGGRQSIEPILREILTKAHEKQNSFPQVDILSKSRTTVNLILGGKPTKHSIKHDGAFKVHGTTDRIMFIECKGYGTDTNSLYSCIFASRLARKKREFEDALFYYISIQDRSEFVGDNATEGIRTIARWAEERKIITGFYGLADLNDWFNSIRREAKS